MRFYYPTKQVALTNYRPLNVRKDNEGLYQPYIWPMTELMFEDVRDGSRLEIKLNYPVHNIRITEEVIDWDSPIDYQLYKEDTGIPHFFHDEKDNEFVFYVGIEKITMMGIATVHGNNQRLVSFDVVTRNHDFLLDEADRLDFRAVDIYVDHHEEMRFKVFDDDNFLILFHHKVGYYFDHVSTMDRNPFREAIRRRLDHELGPIFDARINKLRLLKTVDLLPPAGREYLSAMLHFNNLQSLYVR